MEPSSSQKMPSAIMDKPKIDTKDESTEYVGIPGWSWWI